MESTSEAQGPEQSLRVVWLRLKLAFFSSVSRIIDGWPKFTWYQKVAILVIGLWPTPGTQGGIVYTIGKLIAAFVLVYLIVSFTRDDEDSQESSA